MRTQLAIGKLTVEKKKEVRNLLKFPMRYRCYGCLRNRHFIKFGEDMITGVRRKFGSKYARERRCRACEGQ